jgi:hypothetical protein
MYSVSALPGCLGFGFFFTGGVARFSLNHRLQAVKPPAYVAMMRDARLCDGLIV